MEIISLIVGIVVVLFSIVAAVICICKTPNNNLRPWYTKLFTIVAAAGFIGGVYLIVSTLISLFS